MMRFVSFVCIFVCSFSVSYGWGQDKIALSDVKTLTLTNGRMTTARRSAPVKQLNCVGGSAGCHKFVPQVVQCTNKGSDGNDIQWECKTDMDKQFRFGQIEVSCEGYEYPDDPFILKGSCGLEYTIDYTGDSWSSYSHDYGSLGKSSSSFGNLIFLAMIALVIYAVYRTCVANAATDTPYPRADSSYPRATAPPPPPPGFRPEYTDNYGSGSYGSSYGCNSNSYSAHRPRNDGAGFWSGMGLGGMAGYLFGSRGGQTYTGYGNPGYGSGSRWGGSGSSGYGSNSGFFGSSGGSSGSRTATGFGGTKRR